MIFLLSFAKNAKYYLLQKNAMGYLLNGSDAKIN